MPYATKEQARAAHRAWYRKNKEHHAARQRAWYRRNAESQKARAAELRRLNRDKILVQRKASYWRNKDVIRWRELFRRYGITADDYEALLKAQNGVCAICLQQERGKFKNLSVDHHHGTGKVRGLLCSFCNRSLPLVEDSARLAQALAYLARAQ